MQIFCFHLSVCFLRQALYLFSTSLSLLSSVFFLSLPLFRLVLSPPLPPPPSACSLAAGMLLHQKKTPVGYRMQASELLFSLLAINYIIEVSHIVLIMPPPSNAAFRDPVFFLRGPLWGFHLVKEFSQQTTRLERRHFRE